MAIYWSCCEHEKDANKIMHVQNEKGMFDFWKNFECTLKYQYFDEMMMKNFTMACCGMMKKLKFTLNLIFFE